ncbi:DHA2 family efflux MFS transporter permease subunit [Zavarzinia sp.]|uniref:DHA2 family efflux MFS transporter permease subunit n=1 Tax=Zavarzinia sp. TaxID=2027920 RepID=UPI00356A823E
MPASPMPTGDNRRPDFRTVALIVAAAMFMEQLDGTILATALPAMAQDFGVTAPGMSIALTSYLLSLAVFVPASGKVADHFGSRTVFRAAILVFIVGSVACSLAPNLPMLVAARLLQGLGGAMMMPVGRLILLRSTDKKDMVAATSWMLVPALMGPIVGPPLGGFIVTYVDWRWIFYINLPIGLLGLVLVSLYIENHKGDAVEDFDLAGMALSGVALGSLYFALELASRGEALRIAALLAAIGLVAGFFYIRHARNHPSPILDLSLMRVPTFRLSVIAGSLTRITQGAQPFLLPLLFQLAFGMTAAESGSIVLATAAGSLAMKALAPRILRRFGFRRALTVNGVVCSLAYATCAGFGPGWPHGLLFGVLVFCGFSMSFQFTAYNTVAYAELPPARMSAATSFYTTFQQLMLSLGVCAGAAILQAAMLIGGSTVPVRGDFAAAFLIVTAISLLATLWNRRFAPDAGAEISGHHPAPH